MPIFEWTYYGNTVRTWLIALVVALATLAGLSALRRLIGWRLASPAHPSRVVHDVARDILAGTRWYFRLALAVYAGALVLDLPATPSRLLGGAVVVAVLIQAGVWGTRILSDALGRYMKRAMQQDAAAATTVSAFGFVGRVLLWTAILFLALDNLGVNITALVAGLGVGGIAVALALQNILGDLFASFSIVLDKPFVIGDFIIVGEYLGTVEHIGLKTTRLRSLSGEQVVFSNSDLLNSRVRNFKRMFERRVVFTLGVTYQTHGQKLAAIPAIVREIVEAQDQARFDRAHFKSYGDFALLFEVVYYVLSPDYNVYMDVQQAINLEIFRRFQQEGIDFAYPTQTVYILSGSMPGSAAP
jgi:small-conductance mechanosensitive channel